MPVQPTYPGVYIEEIPSGVRTITGVATSITAFIGRAQRGPVNRAVLINNYGDFERQFGGLWVESRLAYAVRDFYQNGGGQAVIVRLYHAAAEGDSPGAAAAKAIQAAKEAAATAAAAAAVEIDDGAPDALKDDLQAIKDSAQADAESTLEAARGKILAYLAPKKQAAKAKLAAARALPAGDERDDAVAAAEAELAAINASITTVENTTDPDDFDNIVSDDDAAAPAEPAPEALSSEEFGCAHLDANGLALRAVSPGKWGHRLRARVRFPDARVKEQLQNSYPDISPDNFFNLVVRDMASGVTEVYNNVVAMPGNRRDIAKMLENNSRLVVVDGDAAKPGAEHSEAPQPGNNIWEDNSTSTPALEDGSDGGALTADDFVGDGKEANKRGLYALEAVDLFNLLYIPPYQDVNSENGGDIEYDQLVGLVETYCVKRRAMLILDAPSAWTDKDKAREGTRNAETGATTKNTAIFFPRLRMPNPERDGQREVFGAGGAVAGIFARTDVERGVWKAPAGLDATLRGVPELSVPLTDDENGELNPLGLNCLRTFPVYGRVVWGARTARGADVLADEYKYIPVRRTALFIEESLYRGTKWVVFEPNDERTWAAIRLNVGAFMHRLFKQGAFQTKTGKASDSYFVKCDAETTTQTDINLGIVNIVVGFAPLKPVEFVIIKLQQIVGDIET